MTLVAASVVVMMVQAFLPAGAVASTHVNWRGIAAWRLGWKRVAYCSEVNAALRGWEANLGPLEVVHLRSTQRPTAAVPVSRFD